MVALTYKETEQVIEDLRGTCKSIENAIYDLFENDKWLSIDNAQQLDERIFMCEACSWWYEIDEMADNDDWECKGCSDD